MRLVSLNTWKAEGDYVRRIDAMAAGLSALSPDVIALQEDLRTADGLTHTALALARALGLQLSWVPARSKLRKVGLRRTLTTSGLAVLSRQPVLEQRLLALPEDPRDGERVAQCVRLPGPAGDWWLANLHLTHLGDRADLRRQQLEAVLRMMGETAPTCSVVLCGDLNASTEDAEIAGFLRQGMLRDAFAGRPKVTHVDAAGAVRNLDHILFRPGDEQTVAAGFVGVVLDRPEAHGVWPSDHRGVCAELLFSGARAPTP
ncbi:endonuclease/exonuclease/phosphatase family protein [Hydrogenophaga luteola]|uniref:Endonuclease/exonuclease/phosphatase family protein n=1 Tax=Hydrogenophaga luteola TaxID=1591122 RepID=A0ABV7VZF2_9BURK